MKEKINIKNKIEKNEIKNKYKNEINILEIENIINSKNIIKELEENQNELNQYIILNHQLEIEQKNILSQIQELPGIEEEIELLQEQYDNLINKKESINLVKQIIEKSYTEMKQNITPNFTKKLSENMSRISNNKYHNIKLNDEHGLVIETQNGNYITANKLSIGTVDQLYISLRLSILEEITTERLPIILDETFAYFDSNRLENVLKWLSTRYNNQILIFTCTNRETEILNKLNIEYNLIDMN